LKILAEQQVSRDVKILIIDEQPLAQNYLRFALEKLGYNQVQFTERAQIALNWCKETQYDLIICAFNLHTGKDGYQFYEEIKVRRIQGYSTGFIFISAETDPSLVYSVVELQPDEFLAKPYTMRDLQLRIERVLKRKQQLRPIHAWMDLGRADKALQQLDEMLTEGEYPKLVPLLLRTKGDLLLEIGDIHKALSYFQSVLAVQKFGWAQIGEVRCLLAQNNYRQAELQLAQLELKADTRLFALDQKAELEFHRKSFEEAQLSLQQAAALAPRNLYRQQKLMNLSRLNHDYERQYRTARDMVKFARYSVFEQPDLYLNLARACIDFAGSIDEDGETNKLSKQATDALTNLRSNFPNAETLDQQAVIQARLYYLRDQKDKAAKLLEKMETVPEVLPAVEDALDRAKAFHEIGMTQASQAWFDKIAKHCAEQNTDPFLISYLQQERLERAELSTPPRELNNIAVMHYQHGNHQAALAAFQHAFRLLPKNAGIALNLLQSILTAPLGSIDPVSKKKLLKATLAAIHQGKLHPEQSRRFEQLKLKHATEIR
jgi:DNA-binding response OmpR family regulator